MAKEGVEAGAGLNFERKKKRSIIGPREPATFGSHRGSEAARRLRYSHDLLLWLRSAAIHDINSSYTSAMLVESNSHIMVRSLNPPCPISFADSSFTLIACERQSTVL